MRLQIYPLAIGSVAFAYLVLELLPNGVNGGGEGPESEKKGTIAIPWSSEKRFRSSNTAGWQSQSSSDLEAATSTTMTTTTILMSKKMTTTTTTMSIPGVDLLDLRLVHHLHHRLAVASAAEEDKSHFQHQKHLQQRRRRLMAALTKRRKKRRPHDHGQEADINDDTSNYNPTKSADEEETVVEDANAEDNGGKQYVWGENMEPVHLSVSPPPYDNSPHYRELYNDSTNPHSEVLRRKSLTSSSRPPTAVGTETVAVVPPTTNAASINREVTSATDPARATARALASYSAANGCTVDRPNRIGDGKCDSSYNIAECGWDGGDCVVEGYPNCHVPNPHWIGNDKCDSDDLNRIYNTEGCGWDGGDCVVEGYPDCHIINLAWIGNGRCDGGRYNTKECGWDGGDCCWQTCMDTEDDRCGDIEPFKCLDPRFRIYIEADEPDAQRRRERRALKMLYNSTDGARWYVNERWLNKSIDHCYWGDSEQIACLGGVGYVWKIYLGTNDLVGSIPAAMGDLIHLEWLWLYGNMQLSSTIPQSFGNMTKIVHVDFSETQVRGPVPANMMYPALFLTPRDHYSPDNMNDYAQLSPENCADVVDWVDVNGRGCDWYRNNSASCAAFDTQPSDLGHPAKAACCTCGIYGVYYRERGILEELFRTTNGEKWFDNSLWMNNSTQHCDWTGISCRRDGIVTDIVLPSNNLRGNIPTSIGELRSLQKLDLSNNSITGGLPTQVYTLTNLQDLSMRSVTLRGTIPTELSELPLLRLLDLSRTELKGPIPLAIMELALLEDLRLSYNELTGPIPPEIRGMSRLKRLDLDHNQLGGSIPVDIGLLSFLRELRLSRQTTHYADNGDVNFLHGQIPVELGDLQYLTVLELFDNRLSGVLPTELGRLARMETLLLHGNRFRGYIPIEYGLLPRLGNLTMDTHYLNEKKRKPAPLSLCFNKAFDLQSNPFWCPRERNSLKRVYDATNGDEWLKNANWTDQYHDHCSWYGVDCSVRVPCHNFQNWTNRYGDGCESLSSPISCGYSDTNKNANAACCICQQNEYGCSWNGTDCTKDAVTSLSLGANGLSGSLPAELGQLTWLERLFLNENALVGSLPTSLVHLTKLQLVNFTENFLSGRFPDVVATLPSLTQMFLSSNEFRGELFIPSSNSSKLQRLHLANNEFSGDISNAINQLHNFRSLREVDLSRNFFYGSMQNGPMYAISKLSVSGNQRLAVPIPSSLCHNLKLSLDVRDSPNHCPVISFLRLFYNSTHGARWKEPWDLENTTTGICDESMVHGITCDETNTSITEINLPANDLRGTLPYLFGEHLTALSSLRVLNLRQNNLSGPLPFDFSRVPRIEEIVLTDNNFNGTLPEEFSSLSRLKILDIDNNHLTGTLPIEYGRMSSLRQLKLSGNQRHHEHDSYIFSGAQNGLRGGIPIQWGDLANVEHIDLSKNFLNGNIPAELGKLSRLLELHLDENMLTGFVPTELGQLPKLLRLTLTRNKGLLGLAPLSVCSLSDLIEESIFCPIDRMLLKSLYDDTNGDSWANNANWLNEYDPPCQTEKKWFGITCNNESRITGIDLIGNGLYGILTQELFRLRELRALRLGNNRLYGPLPDKIDVHSNLEILQLSGNDLSGEVPLSITNLTSLSVLHLHANKFVKQVPRVNVVSNTTADCGDPYYVGDGNLLCESCTVCCNSEGTCRATSSESYALGLQTAIFVVCLVAFLLVVFVVVFGLQKKMHIWVPKHEAVDYCGSTSVYSFLLTDSIAGWMLCVVTVVGQLGIFVVFLLAANVYDDNSDWVYNLRCPASQLGCEDENSVDFLGWMMFGLITAAFLGKDIIGGVMLVYTAGFEASVLCLVAGVIVSVLTGFTIWTSAQYNLAIATTNTALIANAVIILFVNDIDEKAFELSEWLFPDCVARSQNKVDLHSLVTKQNETIQELQESIKTQKDDFHALVKKQDETIEELHKLIKRQRIAMEQQMSTLEGKFALFSSELPKQTIKTTSLCSGSLPP